MKLRRITGTILAVISFVCLCPLTFSDGQWVAAQGGGTSRAAPIKVGEMAPDFTLEDFRVENDQWRTVTLSSSRGQTPVVLVFYRGHW